MHKEPKVTCLEAVFVHPPSPLLPALRQRVLFNTSGRLQPFPPPRLTAGSVLLTAAGHPLLQHHLSLGHCSLLLRLVFASAQVPWPGGLWLQGLCLPAGDLPAGIVGRGPELIFKLKLLGPDSGSNKEQYQDLDSLHLTCASQRLPSASWRPSLDCSCTIYYAVGLCL